ncbi:hypothetical protein VCRA2113O20_160146 [Vibrio crassostreae]|nr:hypothetical protein VCRA2113O20_160146 [Vibrio crassostreae]CAK1803777.1 hypothetical protein VCRA2117O39_160150 [Vibrio crassostreae]CAK2302581.1 hypothetical protein VCRA2117O143_190117 [Vibrio crassostreae]CAK2674546.1 hypothetical protein VCRA2123O75_160149 [Vibrio crassostreae]CAK2735145.1 hypothetical protein VCRA2119O146_200117 [Vibrio crassostreae]
MSGIDGKEDSGHPTQISNPNRELASRYAPFLFKLEQPYEQYESRTD